MPLGRSDPVRHGLRVHSLASLAQMLAQLLPEAVDHLGPPLGVHHLAAWDLRRLLLQKAPPTPAALLQYAGMPFGGVWVLLFAHPR